MTEHEVVPKNLKIVHDATNRRVPTDKFEIYEQIRNYTPIKSKLMKSKSRKKIRRRKQ